MHCWLVVEPYPSEKYEFVSWDDYSQLNGKIIQMFQTTNQIGIFPDFPYQGLASNVTGSNQR